MCGGCAPKPANPSARTSWRRWALRVCTSGLAQSASTTIWFRWPSKPSKVPAFRWRRYQRAFRQLKPPCDSRSEIKESVRAGAREIDIVISRAPVLTGNWTALYDEVRAFRDACGEAHMKVILATGELGTLRNVGMASL